uniref:Apple domain-containing protein n=1 Tax=Globodera pallida TaxID=36090 RepID=A0A183CBA0_GLOPA
MLDCFTHSPGRALSNASASHEFFNVSPDDCLRFCSTDRVCNTVVYHKNFSTCQLYSGAEEGEAAQEVIAKGHDLYMKKECEEHRREQEKDEAGIARCFQKLERHSIDNSQPLTEIFRSAPTDCLEQCITHTGNGDEQEDPGYCRSVVYDHLQHSCRLYGHDGRKLPAVIHPANGFDMYRRTSSMQECVGPTQRLLALNTKKGAVFGAPSQVQSGKKPIPVTTPAAEDTLSDEELATLLDQLDRKEENGSGARHEGEGRVLKAESAGGVVTELDCAAFGRVTGYLSYVGGQPIEGAEEFMGWSETECAQFCTRDQRHYTREHTQRNGVSPLIVMASAASPSAFQFASNDAFLQISAHWSH